MFTISIEPTDDNIGVLKLFHYYDRPLHPNVCKYTTEPCQGKNTCIEMCARLYIGNPSTFLRSNK